jgi:hypothetical protein
VSPRTIRRLVLTVFVGGIVGMIVGSILDNNGVSITFGLITAGAAVGLILVTAVAPPEAFRRPGGGRVKGADPSPAPSLSTEPSPGADAAGALIEEQVDLLVSTGADEAELRELVRRSIAYGRRSSRR